MHACIHAYTCQVRALVVYDEDLALFPANPWSLAGLRHCHVAMGDETRLAETEAALTRAMEAADVQIQVSCACARAECGVQGTGGEGGGRLRADGLPLGRNPNPNPNPNPNGLPLGGGVHSWLLPACGLVVAAAALALIARGRA